MSAFNIGNMICDMSHTIQRSYHPETQIDPECLTAEGERALKKAQEDFVVGCQRESASTFLALEEAWNCNEKEFTDLFWSDDSIRFHELLKERALKYLQKIAQKETKVPNEDDR